LGRGGNWWRNRRDCGKSFDKVKMWLPRKLEKIQDFNQPTSYQPRQKKAPGPQP
jgi:hypothetical protein